MQKVKSPDFFRAKTAEKNFYVLLRYSLLYIEQVYKTSKSFYLKIKTKCVKVFEWKLKSYRIHLLEIFDLMIKNNKKRRNRIHTIYNLT